MRRFTRTLALALVALLAPILPAGNAHAGDVDFFISFGDGHGYRHHRPHQSFGNHRYDRRYQPDRYRPGHGKKFIHRHYPRAYQRYHGYRKFAGPFECFRVRGGGVVCAPVRRHLR